MVRVFVDVVKDPACGILKVNELNGVEQSLAVQCQFGVSHAERISGEVVHNVRAPEVREGMQGRVVGGKKIREGTARIPQIICVERNNADLDHPTLQRVQGVVVACEGVQQR